MFSDNVRAVVGQPVKAETVNLIAANAERFYQMGWGYVDSGASISTSPGDASFYDIAGMTKTITTKGGPVVALLCAAPDSTLGVVGKVYCTNGVGGIALRRDSATRGIYRLGVENEDGSQSYLWLDDIATGSPQTKTYKLQWSRGGSAGTLAMTYMRFFVFELPLFV